MPNINYHCRVCGLKQEAPPWGENEDTPSFEICSCCGVEFGYEDNSLKSIQKFRKEWISKGAHWFIPENKPSEWILEEQLKNIPSAFLLEDL